MIKMRKFMKKTRGFTLVELIVVIAIIGILAAVLVPSYMYFVENARYRADEADARNMTTILRGHIAGWTSYEINTLEAPEVIAIVNMYDKNYTFVPRVNKWSFWYNMDEHTIEVQKNADTNFFLGVMAAEANTAGNSIEEVVDGYLLLDTAGSDLAEALNSLRNLSDLDAFPDFTDNSDTLANVFKGYGLQTHIQQFDPEHTLYINGVGGLTKAVDKLMNDYASSGFSGTFVPEATVNKIVYASGLKSVPNLKSTIPSGYSLKVVNATNSPLPIRLPVTVVALEEGSLSRVSSASPIVTPNNSTLQVATGAFNPNNALATTNMALVNKEANVILSANAEIRVGVVDKDGNPVLINGVQYIIAGYTPNLPDTTALIVLKEGERVIINVENVTQKMTGVECISSSKRTYNGNSLIHENHIKLFGENGLIGYIIVQYQR